MLPIFVLLVRPIHKDGKTIREISFESMLKYGYIKEVYVGKANLLMIF